MFYRLIQDRFLENNAVPVLTTPSVLVTQSLTEIEYIEKVLLDTVRNSSDSSQYCPAYIMSEMAVVRTSSAKMLKSNPTINRKVPRAAFFSAVFLGSSFITVK